MNLKHALLMVYLTVLIGMLVPLAVSAEISVCVKEGDWIEYQVTFTGDVPEDHAVEGARLEIIDVEGKTIDVNLISIYPNGTEKSLPVTLNLETGQIGDAFIIPANLNSGDTFLEQYEGTITVSRVEEKVCAGANRMVVYATTSHTMYYWDRSTGVLVEATSSYTGFTLTTKAEKTNMWQPQIFGIDPMVFIVLIIVAVVAVLAIFLLLKMKE
ncbi:MAG: hypothetical protein JSW14_08005 [Candidatus Bathyarchaeum sp.]|nr:MAG: hypothetical protein JSW14_08005 [Candidatus Bathyarchaeum sp.]